MHNILKIIAVLAALALTISLACSDRGVNQPPTVVDLPVAPARFDHSFYSEFKFQIANPGEMAQIDAYMPGRVFQRDPLPVVILLPPQGGTEEFYYRHGLAAIADELIANGEIVPMAILTINNLDTFGGFFWAGNGGASGNYDGLMGSPLLDWLRTHSGGHFKDDPRYRGIGGIGQGAYGAFRATMLHQGEFSSIAVADGPLDFDGADDESGFEDMFAAVLDDQGLLDYTVELIDRIDSHYVCDSLVNDTCVDSTLFLIDTVFNPSWTDLFDSSSAYPDARMFIGGALAFSPQDTLIGQFGQERGYYPYPLPVIDSFMIERQGWILDSTFWLCNTPEGDNCADSSMVSDWETDPWHYLYTTWRYGILMYTRIDSSYWVCNIWNGPVLCRDSSEVEVTDDWDFSYFVSSQRAVMDTFITTLRYQIDDTVTLCSEIVDVGEHDFEFCLPFDSTGEPYDPIWNMWLNNNLETILADSGDGCLADIDIWIATTEDPNVQDKSFGHQTRSWISTLQTHGLLNASDVFEYSGYGDNPATSDQYVYDLLREMLIFHSRNFEAAQAADDSALAGQ